MDPVTHAASGALLMLALPRRPQTRWAVPLAALAAASPDIDTAFCWTPELFLALHRGVTHSLAYLPLFALLLALLARPLWRPQTPGRFSLAGCWILCAACLGLHLWLDAVTSYGTMLLLPFSHLRVRLNAVFIVDLLLVLPMLVLAVKAARAGQTPGRKPAGSRAALAGLVWLVAYPLASLAIGHLQAERFVQAELACGRQIERSVLLPDVLSPCFWRVVYEEREQAPQTESPAAERLLVKSQSLGPLGRRGSPAVYEALPAGTAQALRAQSTAAGSCLDFFVLPVVQTLPAPDRQGACLPDGCRALLVHDLRFGSGLAFARRLMAMRPNANIPFRLMVVLDGQDRLLQERIVFSDSRRDTGWRTPTLHPAPSLAAWLAGLE